ncbi:MAG TPA: ABC transporter substrate-binding protein [Stellaceae bacterium]|nr:ABC transporter substrate-binding protein [Stellaceae bacterium]
MKRRDFILMLGAAAWPLSAQADQPTRRIGVLMVYPESDPEAKAWHAAFRDGLRELGWEQDRNISIEYRSAGEDRDRLRGYAAELVGLAPDVLFAAATPSLVALHRETRSIPIVFVQTSDPVKLGLVKSLARPGGNVTGFTNFEHSMGGKWLALIKETVPSTLRVAVISDPNNAANSPYLEAIEAAAPTLEVSLTRLDVRDASEIEYAIGAFAQEAKGALIVLPNVPTMLHRDLIIGLAAHHRLPAVYPYRAFTSAGGFISYGIDLAEEYRRAASYVDRILKGAKPGDLPIQQPDKFELIINLKTAKALGLTIPQSFLLHVDEAIE